MKVEAKTLSFFIPCNPPKSTAQASMRIMKRSDGSQFVGKFANSKGKKTQDELMILLAQHRPEKAFDGAVKLSVSWRYAWRASEPKKNKVNGFKYCDTRPDCSNLVKMFEDCMTRLGYWKDDSQVAILYFEKMWDYRPGIRVEISELCDLK